MSAISQSFPSRAVYQYPLDFLCAAVVERLEHKLPGRVKIEHFPDQPNDYDFEGYEAAALVLYGGSRFDDEGPLGAQGLREVFRLNVVLLVRALRGSHGAYGLMHETRCALHGAHLAGATALRPVECVFESEKEGVFHYRLTFEGALIAAPVRYAQAALPHGFASERR